MQAIFFQGLKKGQKDSWPSPSSKLELTLRVWGGHAEKSLPKLRKSHSLGHRNGHRSRYQFLQQCPRHIPQGQLWSKAVSWAFESLLRWPPNLCSLKSVFYLYQAGLLYQWVQHPLTKHTEHTVKWHLSWLALYFGLSWKQERIPGTTLCRWKEERQTIQPEIMIDREYSTVICLNNSRFFHSSDIMHQPV